MELSTNNKINPNLIFELRAKRSIVFDEANHPMRVMKIYTYAETEGTNPAMARKNMIECIGYNPAVKQTQVMYQQKLLNQFHEIPMKREYFLAPPLINEGSPYEVIEILAGTDEKIESGKPSEIEICRLFPFLEKKNYLTVLRKTFDDSDIILFQLKTNDGKLLTTHIQSFHAWQNFYYALFGTECGIPEKF